MRLKVLVRAVAAALVAMGLTGGPSAQAADRTIRVAIGSTSFAWFPLYVAYGAGFFKDEGLNVEIINMAANSTPVAAMMSGGADIAGLGVQAAFFAIDKGQPIKILTPLATEYTSTIFARPETLRRKGITRQSPIADRVRAMAGLKLATTAIGAGPHLMYRYLFRKYAEGADVDKVAEVVPIGDSAATLASMKRGLVDVSAFSPPVPEKAVADGIGEILIDFIGGDVPEIAGSVYIVLAVSDAKLKTDGPAIAAFLRALERANKLAQSDIIAAGEAARMLLGNMESKLYVEGVKVMKPALPKTATVSVEGLQNFMNMLIVAGYRFDKVDTRAITANDFVSQALSKKN